MFRFSTPRHKFKLPDGVDPTSIEKLFITYKQSGKTIVEKTKDEVTFESGKAVWRLTQEETGRFRPRVPAKIQMRILFENGNSFPSYEVEIEVKDVLKEGVINGD